MYKVSTENKKQAQSNLELIQEQRIELDIQKAQNLADIFYYETLEKTLPLSKDEKIVLTHDKKQLSVLGKAIDYFGSLLDNILTNETNENDKTPSKTRKSTASTNRS
jgi:hypothetical protein